MALKLLSNDLLLVPVIRTQIGRIHLPAQALDPLNAGLVTTWKLVAKGTAKPFEAEPGDNVVIKSISRGPQDVGNGRFILKHPEESVLAVVPVQAPAAVANAQTPQCEPQTPPLCPA